MTRCRCGCLHHKPDGHLPPLYRPAGLVAVMVYVSPVDVDVSIIDRTATLRSFMDLSVPLLLSVLASIHVVSPVVVECLHHRQDGHPPLVHGPPGLVHCLTSWSLNRSRSPNAVLTVSGWMDEWIVCCSCCCQQGISRYLPGLA
jgi:hypothetical protein